MDDKNSITRRNFLQSAAAVAAAAAVARPGEAAVIAPRVKKPNILFLMDDQHRGDAMGCAGNQVVLTPNLDRLAGEGVRFRNAFTTVPSCTAARAGILTGLDPWGHGMLGYTEEATHWPYVLPRAMDDAGYLTHSIGKNHFFPWTNSRGYDGVELHDGLPVTEGVDAYGLFLKKVAPGQTEHCTGLGWNDRGGVMWPLKPEYHPTAWTGQRAVDFLTDYKDDRPFFLKVSFHRPHSPFDPPEHWWDHYGKADLPRAQVADWANQRWGHFTAPQPPAAPRAALPAEDVRNCRQGYYGGISFVDEQIGRIMDALRARGMLENTLVVFCSDHGEMAGDQNLYRKTYPYQGSAHIPMIVRWGDQLLTAARGRVLDQCVELRDLLPTFLDAAGGKPPVTLAGASMLDPIRDSTVKWRPHIDLEHSTCYWKESAWTGLTDGQFKYIYWAYDGWQQLFDLRNDPNELHDLADNPDHARTLADWRGKMVAHLAPRGLAWVRDGDLALRKHPIHRGPNFPDRKQTPAAIKPA
jgi:arylsulfatase